MSNIQGASQLAEMLRIGREVRDLVDASRAMVCGGGGSADHQIAFERGQVAMMLLLSAQNADDDRHTPSFLEGVFFAFGGFLAQVSPEKRDAALAQYPAGVNAGFADFNDQMLPQGRC